MLAVFVPAEAPDDEFERSNAINITTVIRIATAEVMMS
jgi:hypothetical protein